MTLTHEQRANKTAKIIYAFRNLTVDSMSPAIEYAIREAVEEANTLNVSNIIGAAKDRIEAVDKAKADARKTALEEACDIVASWGSAWANSCEPDDVHKANATTQIIYDLKKEMEASDDKE